MEPHSEPVTDDDSITFWDEQYPNGVERFYDDDDPEGFRAKMLKEFRFDVEVGDGCWSEEGGWEFSIPAGLVGKVYGFNRWPLGS